MVANRVGRTVADSLGHVNEVRLLLGAEPLRRKTAEWDLLRFNKLGQRAIIYFLGCKSLWVTEVHRSSQVGACFGGPRLL